MKLKNVNNLKNLVLKSCNFQNKKEQGSKRFWYYSIKNIHKCNNCGKCKKNSPTKKVHNKHVKSSIVKHVSKKCEKWNKLFPTKNVCQKHMNFKHLPVNCNVHEKWFCLETEVRKHKQVDNQVNNLFANNFSSFKFYPLKFHVSIIRTRNKS